MGYCNSFLNLDSGVYYRYIYAMKGSFSLALAFFTLCLSLFFASFASTRAPEVTFVDISGDWILSSIDYDPSRYEGYAGAQQYLDNLASSGEGVSIIFSAEKSGERKFSVSGFSGVNSYSGSISFLGERLIEKPLAVTLASGPENAQRFERFLLQTLNETTSARLLEGGNVLELLGEGGIHRLVFRRFRLEGTAWTLVEYNSGRALQSIRSRNVPSIAFGDGERFSGSTGVNRMLGFYSSDSALRSLSFSTISTTRMGAPSDEIAALESLFVKCLERTSAYRISAFSLILLSSDGESLLVFSRAR